jgi:hypothetical protein
MSFISVKYMSLLADVFWINIFSTNFLSNLYQILAVLNIYFTHKEIYDQCRLVIYPCSTTHRLQSLFAVKVLYQSRRSGIAWHCSSTILIEGVRTNINIFMLSFTSEEIIPLQLDSVIE